MPTWPSSLPQSPLVSGFAETPPMTSLRTEMDQGPAKVRQRTTAGIRKLQMSFNMTKAQIATLDTFYNTTISGGALKFDFTHPRTASTVSVRIVNPPSYAPINGEYYSVGLELEQLP